MPQHKSLAYNETHRLPTSQLGVIKARSSAKSEGYNGTHPGQLQA